MNRRQYIGSLSAASAVSLAGCSQFDTKQDTDTPNRELTAQNLTDHGWRQIDQQEISDSYTVEKFGVKKTITVSGTSTVYEDAAFRKRVAEDTLDKLNTTLRIYFNTELTLDPSLTSLPENIGVKELLDRVEPRVQDSFKSRLTNMGLTNVRKTTEGTFTVDTGEDARLYGYAADYPYDTIEVPLQGDATITIPKGKVGFTALLALWEHDNQLYVAGGGHPGDNVHHETSVAVTDAISADVTIDLKLTSPTFKKELRSLIATTK